MTDKLITTVLLLVAAIHLAPAIGVLGRPRLAKLYGVSIEGPDLEILMRHRAILFGLLGVFLAFSAFTPALFAAGLVAAFISLASFVWLMFSVGKYNQSLRKLLMVDMVALVLVVIGALVLLAT